jgi:hypothetical protein
MHLPWNVALTEPAWARLRALRLKTDISIGDFIEYLVGEYGGQTTFERRHTASKGGLHKSTHITFRLSVTGNARMRQIMRRDDVSGGDIVEALIGLAKAGSAFPHKRDIPHRGEARA